MQYKMLSEGDMIWYYLDMEVIQMNEQVKDYIDKYPSEIIDMYNNLKKMIFDSVSCEPEETLWAKLPSYYVGELKIGI